MSLDAVLARLDADFDASLARLFDLLRIKSISTDPAFAPDVAAAADWCARDLTSIGFEASVRPTQGHPIVIAHWTGPVEREAPHVLFYGHYDVQPVDPIELWTTEPFDPQLVGRADGSQMIVCRGAGDDKGQLMTFVEAMRATVAATGKLPVRVSILLEGEEESGSPSLAGFLEANKAELSKDLAFICDTGMWDRDTPAITATLRGLVGEEITITCASRDLHSGMYGSAAQNPIKVLARLLAKLHDDDGRVMIPNFYDGVDEVPAEVMAMWEGLGLTAEGFLGPIGLTTPAGETGRTILEQIWTRPTCEFNGITGGYTGDGFKTVIASKASAKVSCRLVGDQDPTKIRAELRAFIQRHLPVDATVEFKSHGNGPALRLAFDSPWLDKGRAALKAEWGRDAVVIGSGGSIPVVGNFKRQLGMDSVMIGFGLDDDRIHSPNEKYELSSFKKGARSWARVLAGLAEG